MIKKYLRTSLLLTVGAMLTWGFSSCEKNNDPIEKGLTEKQKEMSQIAKQYVDNTVNLTYKNLAAETSELYDKLKAAKEKFLKDPKSLTQAEVDEICKTFIKARSSYEQSEAFLFGAATDFGVDPHIDTWPLDVDGLAAALTNKYQLEKLGGDENDAIAYAAGKLGQELLGFHGIEFVIFRNGKNRTVAALQANEDNEAFTAIKAQVTGAEELTYATAVAGGPPPPRPPPPRGRGAPPRRRHTRIGWKRSNSRLRVTENRTPMTCSALPKPAAATLPGKRS